MTAATDAAAPSRSRERRGALVALAAIAAAALASAVGAGAPARPSALPPVPVDLNRAGEAEIALLPGLGPDRARRIVVHRDVFGPFRSLDDVVDVKGVGAGALERARGAAVAGLAARE
jgi:competence protein ComEA